MSTPPNILMVYCDELRADALSCYQNGTLRPRTPNVERLAARGTVFENCFCSSPICVASRMSMLTSTPCETHGCYANEGVWPGFTPLPDLITWPEEFATAGYVTASFGKYHVPDRLLKWDHVDVTGGRMNAFSDWLPADHPSVIRIAGLNGGRLPAEAPYPPEQLTANGLAWMEAQSQPWLCRFSYLQPHTPVFPPAWAVKLYEDDPGIDGMLGETGDVSAYERRFAEVIGADRFSPEEIRLTKVYYFALVSWVDRQVGMVLDRLERRGELENTIVLLEADHGAALGEGGRYAKHVFAPEVHRTPRLIACPDRLPSGQRRADIGDSLDVGPTLLGLAGIPVGDRSAGQFRGRDLFADPEPEAVFATIGQGQTDSLAFPNGQWGDWPDGSGWPRRSCLRTRQFRLDRNERIDGCTPEVSQRDIFLCDWRADPTEQHNLAGDPQYGEVLAKLTALLDDHAAGARETTAPSSPGG